MVFLYNSGIKFYLLLIRLAAIGGNGKAKLWIEGRKNIFEQLKDKIKADDQIIWFHAASLGEFEQGRPLIEKIKHEYPDYKILLTFYSPSGYEVRKNYQHADIITYLPLDTRENAIQFIEIAKPQLIVFIKYEFWYHFLNQASKRRLPIIYIAALFHSGMIYFRPYFKVFLPVFNKITHFFVQNKSSETVLKRFVNQLDSNSITIAGDPRIDRVLEIAADSKTFPLLDLFCMDKKVLIGGSTWEKDVEILGGFDDFANWKLIIAPHELAEKNFVQIENQWKNFHCLRYSNATAQNVTTATVLIIDNIGMLSSIYRYAKIAYIGGGFGSGIHNTLEPMAYYIPVIFGPKYSQFEEANCMVDENGAFAVKSSDEFIEIFDNLANTAVYEKATKVVRNYMRNNQGATEKIMDFCRSNFLTK